MAAIATMLRCCTQLFPWPVACVAPQDADSPHGQPIAHHLLAACTAACVTGHGKVTWGSGWQQQPLHACPQPCHPPASPCSALLPLLSLPTPNTPALHLGGGSAGWWVVGWGGVVSGSSSCYKRATPTPHTSTEGH